MRALETDMSEPGFYSDEARAKAGIDRHQALMWEVGDLMNQWEAMQQEADDLAQQVAKSGA